MHWSDRLYRSLIAVADLVNRLDIDSRLLSAAGVKLDRALFPLLARVAMSPGINVAEMSNLVGRDHSTVSRQVVKLEKLGLIVRTPDPVDSRARRLHLSDQGSAIMAKVKAIRRQWMEGHFQDWSEKDRDDLVDLLQEMIGKDWQTGIPPART